MKGTAPRPQEHGIFDLHATSKPSVTRKLAAGVCGVHTQTAEGAGPANATINLYAYPTIMLSTYARPLQRALKFNHVTAVTVLS